MEEPVWLLQQAFLDFPSLRTHDVDYSDVYTGARCHSSVYSSLYRLSRVSHAFEL